MWIYESVTRQEFESIKDIVEKFIVMLGGNRVAIELPYEQRTRSIIGDDIVENISTRPAFEYRGKYYRVDEVCFSKPCIVIEFGTYDELINNIMDEADPFPYDLTEDELLNEVKYSLGIEPYPENNSADPGRCGCLLRLRRRWRAWKETFLKVKRKR